MRAKLPGRHWYASRAVALLAFLGGVAFLGVILFDWINRPYTLTKYGDVAVALGFAFVLAGAVFGAPLVRGGFSFIPLRLLGTISYSVYIWHWALLLVVFSYPGVAAMPETDRLIYMIKHAIPIILFVGTISYLFIEKPFLLMSRGSRPPQPPSADETKTGDRQTAPQEQKPLSRAQRRRHLQPTA